MIKSKYMIMTVLVFVAMSALLAGCQPGAQQPSAGAALQELNISVVATQMKVTEPPAPAPPPGGAAPAKPGGPPAGAPPGPPPTISVTLTFKIDNPNEVEVKLQQLIYSVSGSGISIPVKMGQMFTVESKIPPKGSILREDTIDIVRAGPYAAMWDLIKQVDKWSVNGVALIVQEGFSHPFATTK